MDGTSRACQTPRYLPPPQHGQAVTVTTGLCIRMQGDAAWQQPLPLLQLLGHEACSAMLLPVSFRSEAPPRTGPVSLLP